jgi:hypothetical protein
MRPPSRKLKRNLAGEAWCKRYACEAISGCADHFKNYRAQSRCYLRRRQADALGLYTTPTIMEIAQLAAAALRGLIADAGVAPFFPSCWNDYSVESNRQL